MHGRNSPQHDENVAGGHESREQPMINATLPIDSPIMTREATSHGKPMVPVKNPLCH